MTDDVKKHHRTQNPIRTPREQQKNATRTTKNAMRTTKRLSLGNFPTPVHRLPRLGRAIGIDSLWIKRDDLSGPLGGGNKVRKLEYLFADAQEKNYQALFTIGPHRFQPRSCDGGLRESGRFPRGVSPFPTAAHRVFRVELPNDL